MCHGLRPAQKPASRIAGEGVTQIEARMQLYIEGMCADEGDE
jgi:hypothetical protein